jgi:hypothetical protein
MRLHSLLRTLEWMTLLVVPATFAILHWSGIRFDAIAMLSIPAHRAASWFALVHSPIWAVLGATLIGLIYWVPLNEIDRHID